MKKQWFLALLSGLLSAIAWANPVNVVSSFSILGDVVKNIGGDKVQVVNLVGADQDMHAYHMTSGDVKKIHAAQLVLLNGLGLESSDMVRAVKQSKIPYAMAADGIKALEANHHHHGHDHGHDHHGHDHGDLDPHVWQDPVLMKKYASNVANALIKADANNKAYYQQRLQTYSKELDKLDAYAKAKFSAIPVVQRKVLTGHDAFSYMAQRYQITFLSPQGVSSEAEPSAKQVAALIRQIREQKIKAVFAENIKDTRMVERIAQETGSKVGGKLYSDALSKTGVASSYLGMYRANVDALSRAMK